MDRDFIQDLIREALRKYDAAFEDRLASAIQKGIDSVLFDYEQRIHSLEEDMAKVHRHLGME